MKHQKLIDRITEIAEADDWSVSVNEQEDSVDVLKFTFCKYTDAGQDFSFFAEMRDGDIYSLIENIDNYYEDYDPDEEAFLWLGPDGHGKNGAPYRMTDVVKDMEQCETFVGELLEQLIETNRKECLYELEDEEGLFRIIPIYFDLDGEQQVEVQKKWYYGWVFAATHAYHIGTVTKQIAYNLVCKSVCA